MEIRRRDDRYIFSGTANDWSEIGRAILRALAQEDPSHSIRVRRAGEESEILFKVMVKEAMDCRPRNILSGSVEPWEYIELPEKRSLLIAHDADEQLSFTST